MYNNYTKSNNNIKHKRIEALVPSNSKEAQQEQQNMTYYTMKSGNEMGGDFQNWKWKKKTSTGNIFNKKIQNNLILACNPLITLLVLMQPTKQPLI